MHTSNFFLLLTLTFFALNTRLVFSQQFSQSSIIIKDNISEINKTHFWVYGNENIAFKKQYNSVVLLKKKNELSYNFNEQSMYKECEGCMLVLAVPILSVITGYESVNSFSKNDRKSGYQYLSVSLISAAAFIGRYLYCKHQYKKNHPFGNYY